MAFGYLGKTDLTTSRADVVDVGVTTGSSAGMLMFHVYNPSTSTRTVTCEIDNNDSGTYVEYEEFKLPPNGAARLIVPLDADDTVAFKQDSGTDVDVFVHQVT